MKHDNTNHFIFKVEGYFRDSCTLCLSHFRYFSFHLTDIIGKKLLSLFFSFRFKSKSSICSQLITWLFRRFQEALNIAVPLMVINDMSHFYSITVLTIHLSKLQVC